MKSNSSKILRGAFLLILLLFIITSSAEAQCAMCKAGLETNLKSGGKVGSGINTGILMLLSMPYLLVGGVAYAWYRNRQKNDFDDTSLKEVNNNAL